MAYDPPVTSDLDWEAFFARYRPLALRVAAGLVGPERAEEQVQEAARAVVERVRSGHAPRSVEHARNLFLRVLRHGAISEHRAATRRGPAEELEEPPDPAPPADELLGEREEAERRAALLRDALARLSDDERNALHLRYGEGLTYREMMMRTDRPLSTLQARVEAALAKIRQRVGITGGEAEGAGRTAP